MILKGCFVRVNGKPMLQYDLIDFFKRYLLIIIIIIVYVWFLINLQKKKYSGRRNKSPGFTVNCRALMWLPWLWSDHAVQKPAVLSVILGGGIGHCLFRLYLLLVHGYLTRCSQLRPRVDWNITKGLYTFSFFLKWKYLI